VGVENRLPVVLKQQAFNKTSCDTQTKKAPSPTTGISKRLARTGGPHTEKCKRSIHQDV